MQQPYTGQRNKSNRRGAPSKKQFYDVDMAKNENSRNLGPVKRYGSYHPGQLSDEHLNE